MNPDHLNERLGYTPEQIARKLSNLPHGYVDGGWLDDKGGTNFRPPRFLKARIWLRRLTSRRAEDPDA